MEQQTGSKLGKEYIKAIYISSPCLFNLHAAYIMRNAGLEEAQAGIKVDERNINNLRYTDVTTLTAECEEELKSLLMKMKDIFLLFHLHQEVLYSSSLYAIGWCPQNI